MTFAALAPALPAGHRTELTEDGRLLTGDLVRATADGLVLWRYDTGSQEEVPASRVSAVTYDDSLAYGAVAGAAAGAIPGFLFGLAVQGYCLNESTGSCGRVPIGLAAVTGLVGLGIGSAIDGAVKTTARLEPARPSAPVASVSIRPDRRRPMALVSIAF